MSTERTAAIAGALFVVLALEVGADRFARWSTTRRTLGRALWQSTGYAPQGDWSRWVKSTQ